MTNSRWDKIRQDEFERQQAITDQGRALLRAARERRPKQSSAAPSLASSPQPDVSSPVSRQGAIPSHGSGWTPLNNDVPVRSRFPDIDNSTSPFLVDNDDDDDAEQGATSADMSVDQNAAATPRSNKRGVTASGEDQQRPRKSSKVDSCASPETSHDNARRQGAVDPSERRALEKRPASTVSPQLPAPSQTASNLHLPEWYERLGKGQTRDRNTSSTADMKLGQLKSKINEFKREGERGLTTMADPKKYGALIQTLHEAMFYDVSAQLVRNHFLLHSGAGLPVLFDPASSKGMTYPFYIKADAEELYHKWWNKNFKPDLLHDLKLDQKSKSFRIEPGYIKPTEGAAHGNNGLVNGQWWPLQICLVRDGAHSDMQGGISGRTNLGAWSIVLSAGQRESGGVYPNIDEGDVLEYCGTDAKENGAVTENTQRMIQSYQQNKEIHVFRSSKAPNKTWAPEMGFRYDGLYDIVSFQIIDQKTKCHRFRMVRQAGQDPIRNSGPEKRPTEQELTAWRKLKSEMKFIVNFD
ncbi:hypothetical protein MBLNU457_2130t1 [Dothideomycetes sp. NU457]